VIVPETSVEIARAVRDGSCRAVDTVQERVNRAEFWQPRLNALLQPDATTALRAAEKLDRRRERGEPLGPLAGVPIVVKDNLCTEHGLTTCGSRLLAGFHAKYNAHVVERLLAADAILLGKTNLDEFAMGSSTENSAFGPVKNPWDLRRVSGGSSGGSAAAVAARIVPGALGSDTGGSVRQPAAMCGVVGLKPTYGCVSRFGLAAFGSSLDQIGPLATTIEDAALLLSIIAGHDPLDATSSDQSVPDYPRLLDRPIKGLRLGIAEEHFSEGLDSSVRHAVMQAVDLLRSEGAETVPVNLPHARYGIACYYLIATAEASSNLARYDGLRYGVRAENPADIHSLYARSRGRGLGTEVKRRIMLGTFALSAGYHDKYYLKAQKVRTLIQWDFEEAFQKVDLMVSPVSPTTAFPIGEKSDDPLSMYLADVYTTAANLAGICALSMPCGFDELGLPIGLQLMGPAFAEATLLAAGHQFQLRTDYHKRLPPQ